MTAVPSGRIVAYRSTSLEELGEKPAGGPPRSSKFLRAFCLEYDATIARLILRNDELARKGARRGFLLGGGGYLIGSVSVTRQ